MASEWQINRLPGLLAIKMVADMTMPIVARLNKHRKTLLNIEKHHETLVKHCDTSRNVVKHREPLVKHHETLKTL